MKPTRVTEGIYRLSLNVEDLLFEQLWQLPNGVTLNSYIVRGDKTAIIDGVCGWDGVPQKLYQLFDQLEINGDEVDYVIINHMEPDHSGWIESFRKMYPDVQIYCTKMAANLLRDFFSITENVHVIKKDQQLNLGQGKVLQFIPQPGVHWPDTMMTFEQSSRALFPCDMFGSFGICENNHYDDQFSDADRSYFWDEQIRYFSNVLVTFNPAVKRAIATTTQLQPKIIAPGHGPVYRQGVNHLIDNYQRITGLPEGGGLDEVTLLWGSMYGMTEHAVRAIASHLNELGLTLNSLQLPQTPIGDVMNYSLRAKYIIVAAPTYENNLFPPAVQAIDELGRKKVRAKKALYIGSYGWSGGGQKDFEHLLAHHAMQWQLNDALTFQGLPSEEMLTKIKTAVDALIE